jgi:tetratricopeptide (TPR) repeat protein
MAVRPERQLAATEEEQKMRECPQCRAPYAAEDRYCGQCGVRLGKVDAADGGARTQKALDLVDVYYHLGLVYFKKGQYREALDTWNKGLARDPGNELLRQRIEEARARMGAER